MLQAQEAHGQNHDYQALQYNVAPPVDSYHTIQYQQNDADQQHYAAPVVSQEYGVPQHTDYNYQPQQPEHEYSHQQEDLEAAIPQAQADPHSQLAYQSDGAPEAQYQNDFQPSAVDHSHHEEEAHSPQQSPVSYGHDASSQHEDESHHDSGSLLTSENFPSDKHTHVIFKTTTEEPYDYHSSHAPAVQVQTVRAPLVYHKLEQFYGNNHDYNAEQDYGSHADIDPVVTEANYVTITPRPSAPYNYHAHPAEQYDDDYSSAASSISARSSKRQAQPTEEPYKKFTNLMNRLKQRMASTKTTASSSATA